MKVVMAVIIHLIQGAIPAPTTISSTMVCASLAVLTGSTRKLKRAWRVIQTVCNVLAQAPKSAQCVQQDPSSRVHLSVDQLFVGTDNMKMKQHKNAKTVIPTAETVMDQVVLTACPVRPQRMVGSSRMGSVYCVLNCTLDLSSMNKLRHVQKHVVTGIIWVTKNVMMGTSRMEMDVRACVRLKKVGNATEATLSRKTLASD